MKGEVGIWSQGLYLPRTA